MGDVEIREGLGGSRHISARASADPSRIDGLRVTTSSCSSAAPSFRWARVHDNDAQSLTPADHTLRTHGEIRAHSDNTEDQ